MLLASIKVVAIQDASSSLSLDCGRRMNIGYIVLAWPARTHQGIRAQTREPPQGACQDQFMGITSSSRQSALGLAGVVSGSLYVCSVNSSIQSGR